MCEDQASGEEEEAVEEQPISALPPEAAQEEEGPTPVSSSPAFQCLDEESEIRQLQDAKRFTAELEKQQRELEKADRFPEGVNTEVGRMRRQLLIYLNNIREAEEMEYQLQYQMECLKGEKDVLEKEYDSQPKPAKNLQREQEGLDKKKDSIEALELGKEIDRIKRKKTDVQKKTAELEQQLVDLGKVHKDMQVKKEELEQERKEVLAELEKRRRELEAAEREQNMLQKDKDVIQEKEAIMMGQRGMLDINLSHINLERKTLQEHLMRNQKDKDRQLHSLKNMELKLKMGTDSLGDTQFQYNKIKSQRDAMPSGEEDLLRRNELQKEVEHLRRNLMHQ
ncbi:hypothetical protein JZ751_024153, partial [Albula glossodonta]